MSPQYIAAMMNSATSIEPKPLAESEVPARIVTRDDGADAQRPQRPHLGVALETAILEIVRADLLVADAAGR